MNDNTNTDDYFDRVLKKIRNMSNEEISEHIAEIINDIQLNKEERY